MSNNQKRDSKGRFRSKPKGFDAPANVDIPGKPAPAVPKKKKEQQKRTIRLVKNPVYEPVMATRTMEEALQPVKDARSKRKRDKARKTMENTFGDIDWEEGPGTSSDVQAPRNSAEETAQQATSSTGEWEANSVLAAAADRTSEAGVTRASTREELIAASGHSGNVWVREQDSGEFSLLAENVTLRFVYAEDAYGDTVPEELLHADHARVEGLTFTKSFGIGTVAFLSHA